jgi:hypothetical protein
MISASKWWSPSAQTARPLGPAVTDHTVQNMTKSSTSYSSLEKETTFRLQGMV